MDTIKVLMNIHLTIWRGRFFRDDKTDDESYLLINCKCPCASTWEMGRSKKNQLNAKLLRACVYRDLGMAKEALDEGANVNCRRYDTMAPLHIAAEHGDTELIRLLRKIPKASIEIRTMHGLTPLHTATLLSHTKAVYTLLNLGATPNSLDNLGRTPLHYAALQRDVNTVRILIRRNADVNLHDAFHESPLYTSILRRPCLPMTKLLLHHGASVLAKVSEGSLGLLLEVVLSAREQPDFHMLDLIFEKGVSVNTTDPIAWRTPLHMAAINGNLELATYLIERGAALHAKTRAGQTPMDVALNFHNYNVAQLLEESSLRSTQLRYYNNTSNN